MALLVLCLTCYSRSKSHLRFMCLFMRLIYAVQLDIVNPFSQCTAQDVRYQSGIHIAFGVKFKHPVSLKGFRTAYITILVGEDEQI